MAVPEYGRQLLAAEAEKILKAAGITKDFWIGPDGYDFTYNGVKYWILQLSFQWPGPTRYSPDGSHVVYAPSQEEIDVGEEPEEEGPTSIWGLWLEAKPFLTIILMLVGGFLILRFLNVFKT